jgi:hypothetical protein
VGDTASMIRRLIYLGASMLLIPLAGGCAAWNAERWSFDSLRDERAVDIERRLSSDKPIVENPFRKADEKADRDP